MYKKVLVSLAVLCAIFISPAFAPLPLQPPDYAPNAPWIISFQGKLDGVSSPVSSITFRIYSFVENSELQIWEETHYNVELDNGIFNVLLGTLTPLPKQGFEITSVLEVSVDNTPLSPRQPLAAAPVAFVARNQKYGTVDARNAWGSAVKGFSEGGGSGVYGEGLGMTFAQAGVYGKNDNGYGVYGKSVLASGAGVYGSSMYGHGVMGSSAGPTKSGVYGENNDSNGYGVYGTSTDGTGVYGFGGVGGYGVHGDNYANYGVYGTSTAGFGVYARSSGEAKAGVYGTNVAPTGYGVFGESTDGTAVFAKSTNGKAIFATNESASEPTLYIANNLPLVQFQPEDYGTALFIEKGKIKVPVKDHQGFQPPAGAVTGIVDVIIQNTNNVGNSSRIYNRYISDDSQIFFTVKPMSQFHYPPMMFLYEQGVDTQGGYFTLGWGPTEIPAYNTGTFRVTYLVVN